LVRIPWLSLIRNRKAKLREMESIWQPHADKQDNSRCSDCGELPGCRITNLIKMGNDLHRREYLPNLGRIREMGVQKWIEYEEERWRCPQCGLPMSWYDANCLRCGEARSEPLFPLK